MTKASPSMPTPRQIREAPPMSALYAEIAAALRPVIREEVERALAAQKEPPASFLTVNEAAKEFRVTPRTIRKWIDDGSIASERRGGRVLIPREALG